MQAKNFEFKTKTMFVQITSKSNFLPFFFIASKLDGYIFQKKLVDGNIRPSITTGFFMTGSRENFESSSSDNPAKATCGILL